MSMAFEITEDDVVNVLNSHNVNPPNNMEDVMSIINDSEIAESALSVDIDSEDDEDEILMKQTEAAYDEIAWQLFQAGIITQSQIRKYGNTALLTKVLKK